MFNVLYEASRTIQRIGPFPTEAEATQAAREAQAEGEFSLVHQRVYLLHPDHSLVEYGWSDLVDESRA